MILRRVIKHFRKQEWTAIAIDFVVVGVLISFQVSNRNDARIKLRSFPRKQESGAKSVPGPRFRGEMRA